VIAIEVTRDLPLVRELLEEYVAALGVDLSFQNFDEEIAHLDTFYKVILIARVDGSVAGCVALREVDPRSCEMKRLYVRPQYRRHGLGRRLIEALIEDARPRGYSRMLLDTLPSMTSAIALYVSMGFTDVAPYRVNPIEGSRYFALSIREA
jgi:putative acetyltransferase